MDLKYHTLNHTFNNSIVLVISSFLKTSTYFLFYFLKVYKLFTNVLMQVNEFN
ncbi:hypothetical protein HanPSC8_Chr10g0426551 [Helianthus annuus]|nr:hypothetical protein HanPSC8_Chr10g0426551 [Helianthus annuus]